ncbi:MAG: type IX secretion system outer membrane channel protein PorV [Bacteroidota bacterium]|nr:type IX secretion system outer membrane channel protein PorV [Bacteroidota bacterium]
MKTFLIGKKLLISITLLGLTTMVSAQTTKTNYLGQDLNTVTTAVPFLMIAPDARGGAMGDAGVSSTPDAFSQHWNPAKYAFIDTDMGFSLSYSPWMRKLVSDINLAYVTGYKKLDEMQAISASLLYFSLGDITFTDISGQTIGNYRPNEFALDFAYSRKLSENLSGAISARFIHSNLTQGQDVGSTTTKPGNSVATDVSVYYQKKTTVFNTDALFAWGVNISNIGSKISYTDDNTHKDFIPTNLRIGPSLMFNLDEYNSLTFMADFNKLLVPTPPKLDSIGNIIAGKNPDVSVPQGMIQSFYDAPGGFKEELHEITLSLGAEYWYNKQFALRAGYFYEHPTKGNRKYFTMGAGLKYSKFRLDLSYLVPTEQHNPLENTLRFSMILDFDALKAATKDTPATTGN